MLFDPWIRSSYGSDSRNSDDPVGGLMRVVGEPFPAPLFAVPVEQPVGDHAEPGGPGFAMTRESPLEATGLIRRAGRKMARTSVRMLTAVSGR